MNALPKTADLAQGKWPGILSALGLDDRTLSRKNCPCPMCGGKDRFRFTDHEQQGMWVCNQCGSGDGLGLLMQVNGWDFKAACAEVDQIVGNISVNPAPAKKTEAERMADVRKLWESGVPVVKGDPVHRYLSGRDVAFVGSFPDIRCVHSIHFAGRELSMMLALLRDSAGRPVTVHRTFVQDGRKADIEKPRMMMAGAMPDVPAAVRLGEVRSHIGIAEGIETAAAAAKLFKLPVWATLNTSLMEKWTPPQGVKRVTIFADNDANYAGFRAAYRLANCLASDDRINVRVDVEKPSQPGTDFWDEMQEARLDQIHQAHECAA